MIPLMILAGLSVIGVVGGCLWFGIRLYKRIIKPRRLIESRCCPICGYPAGKRDVCTECGHKLPWRLRAES